MRRNFVLPLILLAGLAALVVGCSDSNSPTEPNKHYKTFDGYLVNAEGVPIARLNVLMRAPDTGDPSELLFTDRDGYVTAELQTNVDDPDTVYIDVTSSSLGDVYEPIHDLVPVSRIEDSKRGRVYQWRQRVSLKQGVTRAQEQAWLERAAAEARDLGGGGR